VKTVKDSGSRRFGAGPGKGKRFKGRVEPGEEAESRQGPAKETFRGRVEPGEDAESRAGKGRGRDRIVRIVNDYSQISFTVSPGPPPLNPSPYSCSAPDP
jgi:hypothetical protein